MREMKDSGIEWIGEIPKDWKLIKIGNIYDERKIKVSDKDYEPLSVTKNGIVPQLESAAKSNDNDNRKLIKKNDFVINSRSDRRGSCGISNYDGSCSLINTVLKPRDYMINQYYNYVFRSELFADEFYKWGSGIVNDLWTTKWTSMKKIYIPYPELNQQEKIANFLDDKCNKIDQMIAKEQEEIEKLKEYKQSIITETVTKGLNSNVEMKDSGNVIVGLIPSNWEVIKLKRIAKQFYRGSGITKEEIVENGETACVRYGEIYTRYDIFFDTCLTKTNKNKLSNLQYFSYGDILFTLTGELVEEIGKSIVYLGTQECLAGGDIAIMKHNQNPKFLGYALRSDSSIAQKGYGKSKLKVVHTSVSHLGDIMIALPNLEEQSKIVQFLDKKINNINLLIMNRNKIIEKLMSYKKSLIYEVVTGKKEV